MKKSKKNVKHQTRKKVSKSKRGKAAKAVRKRLSNRGAKASGKTDKRKKPVQKNLVKRAVLVQGKPGKKGAKVVKGNAAVTRAATLNIAKHKRGDQSINVSFKGSTEIESKIKAFESSEKLKQSIKEQLKRKGGKPPKSIIFLVKDKKGATAAHVPRSSFVANEANIKKEIKKFAKELKKDYSKFAQELADIEAEGGTDVESEGYEDYNPDNISEISLKFIY